MKRSLIALAALAGTAGLANAQAFFEVILDDGNGETGNAVTVDTATDNTLIAVSLYIDRNGDTDGFFSSFKAWSQFGGTLQHNVAGATGWVVPVEGATPGQTQSDPWQGRRPPAFPVPGGAGGGFRFQAQTFKTEGAGTVLTANNGLIAGIQASTALGGFSQDSSPRIEIFRATLDVSNAAAGFYDVTWVNGLTQIFIDTYNIERSVFDQMASNEARITIVPTPATASLLGLGGLAALRRRR